MQPESDVSLALVLEVVGETVADWDLDLGEVLAPESRLSADLCFSSIEVMHLFATIDVRLGRKLPYDQLIRQDGVFRSELTIGELARFVAAQPPVAPPPQIARPV
jgi:acyl carrier protein